MLALMDIEGNAMAAALGLDNKIWASLRKEYKLGRISEIEEIEGASSTVQYKLESAGKKLVLRLEDERSANNLGSNWGSTTTEVGEANPPIWSRCAKSCTSKATRK